jgi:hypothetical protein
MLGRVNANEYAEVRAGRLAQAAHTICLWLSGLRAKHGMLRRAVARLLVTRAAAAASLPHRRHKLLRV